jgi:hypothetical protein
VQSTWLPWLPGGMGRSDSRGGVSAPGFQGPPSPLLPVDGASWPLVLPPLSDWDLQSSAAVSPGRLGPVRAS